MKEKQVDIFKELTLDEMLLIAGGIKMPPATTVDGTPDLKGSMG